MIEKGEVILDHKWYTFYILWFWTGVREDASYYVTECTYRCNKLLLRLLNSEQKCWPSHDLHNIKAEETMGVVVLQQQLQQPWKRPQWWWYCSNSFTAQQLSLSFCFVFPISFHLVWIIPSCLDSVSGLCCIQPFLH